VRRHRLAHAAQRLQHGAEIAVAVGQIRPHGDRLAQDCLRLLRTVLHHYRHTQQLGDLPHAGGGLQDGPA
jgi:hypothetical protein